MRLKSLLVKSLLVLLVFDQYLVANTSSYYNDKERSSKNGLSASVLDLGLYRGGNDDEEDRENCRRGEREIDDERIDEQGDHEDEGDVDHHDSDKKHNWIQVENIGELPFNYNLEVSQLENSDYCNKVKVIVYLVNGESNTKVYEGLLKDFKLNLDGLNPDLHLGPLDSPHRFIFEFDYEKKKRCSFEIISKAWQDGYSYPGSYSDIEEVTFN